MPTYSYECDNCKYQFDIFQHFSDDSLTTCPQCRKETLRKVYTPVGIVFKGSGFYATDHRSPSGMMPSPHEHDADNGSKDTAASESKKETHESSGSKTEPAKETKTTAEKSTAAAASESGKKAD